MFNTQILIIANHTAIYNNLLIWFASVLFAYWVCTDIPVVRHLLNLTMWLVKFRIVSIFAPTSIFINSDKAQFT